MPVNYATESQTRDVIAIGHKDGDLPPFIPDGPSDPNGSDHNHESENDPRPLLKNAIIAMLLFIGADVMFFASLIGAFLVFRIGMPDWPPPGQPLLPVEITGVNTFILLISGVTMFCAWQKIRLGNQQGLAKNLVATGIFGTIFLLIQGYEWIQLISFGLTLSSSIYGATFYILIGCHALHVLGAVIWLIIVLKNTFKKRFTAQNYTGVQLCGMYWFLVVLMWPFLYSLVYFN